MCMDETHEVDESSGKTVDKFQLMEMLSSIVNLAKTTHVNNTDIHATIESLFEDAGLKHKKVGTLTNMENTIRNIMLKFILDYVFTNLHTYKVHCILDFDLSRFQACDVRKFKQWKFQ